MKTKTRETKVDTELVDRINKMRGEAAINLVDKAVRQQAEQHDAQWQNGGTTLRAAWAVLKEKLTSNN